MLAHAEDELALDLARRRLADRRPWLSEEELEAALARAAEERPGSRLRETFA